MSEEMYQTILRLIPNTLGMTLLIVSHIVGWCYIKNSKELKEYARKEHNSVFPQVLMIVLGCIFLIYGWFVPYDIYNIGVLVILFIIYLILCIKTNKKKRALELSLFEDTAKTDLIHLLQEISETKEYNLNTDCFNIIQKADRNQFMYILTNIYSIRGELKRPEEIVEFLNKLCSKETLINNL